MKLFGVALIAVTLFSGTASAQCPIGNLLKRADQSFAGLKKIEIREQKRESTDGGVWLVYLDRDDRPRMIDLNLSYESGYADIFISFISANNYVLKVVASDFNHPYSTDTVSFPEPLKVVKVETSYYFYCGDTVYGPVPLNEDAEGLKKATDGVKAYRDSFFEAQEIAPYIAQLRPSGDVP